MDNSVFESVEYNLDLICRVCMQESYNLRSIFDESVQTQPLNEIVMACAQIQIAVDDGMPNQICEFCLGQVHTAYDFKVKCELSDSLLRGYLVRKTAMATIKDENVEEEDDDDCQIIVPDQSAVKSEVTYEDEMISDPTENYTNDESYFDTPWMGGYDEYAVDDNEDGMDYSGSILQNFENDGKPMAEPPIDYKAARTADGRYSCQFCDLTLADSQGLKYHTRLHTGYGLSRCSVCGKGFTKRSHLQRHMETHSNKQYKCRSCSEVFYNVVDLKLHIRNVHERKIDKNASLDESSDEFELIPPPIVKIEEITHEKEQQPPTLNSPDNDEKQIDDLKMDMDDTETEPTDTFNALPEKSKLSYQKQYDTFLEWCRTKHFDQYSEPVLLQYFTEKSENLKSSTLWSIYSMLRATMSIKLSVNISNYKNLTTFLRKKAVGYKSEKSKVFNRDEINRFLTEAPDECYLMMKVVLIMGIAGGCRIDEFTHFTLDDIEDHGAMMMIRISHKSQPRSFIINNDPNSSLDFLSLFRKYISLRPKHAGTTRFFIHYSSGKCTTHVLGKNTFGKIPSRIAEYLNLPDHASYTGHCFRSTAISLKSGFEGGLISLSRHQRIQTDLMPSTSVIKPHQVVEQKLVKPPQNVELKVVNEDGRIHHRIQTLFNASVASSVSRQQSNIEEIKYENILNHHDGHGFLSDTPMVNDNKFRTVNRAEKVKTFSRDEIERFMSDAPDECYLLMKVILMVGVAGGCRIDEFINLTLDNIEDHGEVIIITIIDHIKSSRSFTIMNNPKSFIDYLAIFRKYASLRPKHTETTRFFIHYANGKCITQVVGKNSIGKVPSRIAEYLNLPDHTSYNGYSFRSTAQYLQLNFGGALMSLSHNKSHNQSIQPGPSLCGKMEEEDDRKVDVFRMNSEIETIKVEPEIMLEDSVIQYLRNENNK